MDVYAVTPNSVMISADGEYVGRCCVQGWWCEQFEDSDAIAPLPPEIGGTVQAPSRKDFSIYSGLTYPKVEGNLDPSKTEPAVCALVDIRGRHKRCTGTFVRDVNDRVGFLTAGHCGKVESGGFDATAIKCPGAVEYRLTGDQGYAPSQARIDGDRDAVLLFVEPLANAPLDDVHPHVLPLYPANAADPFSLPGTPVSAVEYRPTGGGSPGASAHSATERQEIFSGEIAECVPGGPYDPPPNAEPCSRNASAQCELFFGPCNAERWGYANLQGTYWATRAARSTWSTASQVSDTSSEHSAPFRSWPGPETDTALRHTRCG